MVCLAGALVVSAGNVSVAGAKSTDYRQSGAYKSADAQVVEVDRLLGQIQKVQESLESAEDASSIPAKTVTEMNDQIKFANNRLSNAERAIKNLPASDPAVKAELDKIAAQRAALSKASQVGADFLKKQGKAAEVGTGDQFKIDLEKVKGLAKAYAPFNLTSDPKRTGELAARLKEDATELDALKKTYQPIVTQKTPEGKQFSYAFDQANNNIRQFHARGQEFVNKAGESIAETTEKALKMAEQAAAEKKPAFFTGGVKQQLDNARKELATFTAIAGEKHEKTIKLQAQFDEASKKIATIESSMKEEILASTKTPADVYKNSDKAQLKGLVEAEWKARYPKDELLGVRFVQAEWKRKSGSAWNAGNKAFEDFDHSELVARVVVKNDAKLSSIYWVYIDKDHKSNDQITVNANTKGGIYIVDEMLTSNWEP